MGTEISFAHPMNGGCFFRMQVQILFLAGGDKLCFCGIIGGSSDPFKYFIATILKVNNVLIAIRLKLGL